MSVFNCSGYRVLHFLKHSSVYFPGPVAGGGKFIVFNTIDIRWLTCLDPVLGSRVGQQFEKVKISNDELNLVVLVETLDYSSCVLHHEESTALVKTAP